MTFLQLYGVELDRELASSSTQLFTTARRQAAINAGQLAFIKETECLQRQASLSLTTAVQEYDLDTLVTDFAWIAKQGVSIAITSGATVRYIEGDDLEVTSIERLNVERAGWRAETASTPDSVYLRRDGGTLNLGFVPAPSITGSDTWVALVPYVIVPTDMSADSDLPFTVSGNAVSSLRPFHRAVVHYGAYDLEKLRKDLPRSAAQLQLFEQQVAQYQETLKPTGGQHVRMATVYRRNAEMTLRGRRFNPRA